MGGITIPANEEDASSSSVKRIKQDLDEDSIDVGIASSTSSAGTESNNQTLQETIYVPGATCVQQQQLQQTNQLHLQTDNNSDNEALVVDGDGPANESMSEYKSNYIFYIYILLSV